MIKCSNCANLCKLGNKYICTKTKTKVMYLSLLEPFISNCNHYKKIHEKEKNERNCKDHSTKEMPCAGFCVHWIENKCELFKGTSKPKHWKQCIRYEK